MVISFPIAEFGLLTVVNSRKKKRVGKRDQMRFLSQNTERRTYEIASSVEEVFNYYQFENEWYYDERTCL